MEAEVRRPPQVGPSVSVSTHVSDGKSLSVADVAEQRYHERMFNRLGRFECSGTICCALVRRFHLRHLA